MKERLFYLDSAKAIGILLLIIGHLTRGKVQAMIYSFHMPLFVVVSGCLFEYRGEAQKKIEVFMNTKIRSLIIPYIKGSIFLVVIGIVYNMMQIECWYMPSYKYIIILIIDFFMGAGIGTLWFLPFLFIVEVSFYFLVKKKYGLYFSVLIAVIGILSHNIVVKINIAQNGISGLVGVVVLDLCNVVLRSCIGLPFMWIGMFWQKKCYNNKMGGRISEYLLMFILCIVCIVWVGNVILTGTKMVDLYSLSIGNPFTYYINAIFGSMFIMMLCKKCLDYKTRFSENMGGESLLYMLFNNLPFITLISSIFNNTLGIHSTIMDIVSVVIIETFIVVIVRHNRCFRKLFYAE